MRTDEKEPDATTCRGIARKYEWPPWRRPRAAPSRTVQSERPRGAFVRANGSNGQGFAAYPGLAGPDPAQYGPREGNYRSRRGRVDFAAHAARRHSQAPAVARVLPSSVQ